MAPAAGGEGGRGPYTRPAMSATGQDRSDPHAAEPRCGGDGGARGVTAAGWAVATEPVTLLGFLEGVEEPPRAVLERAAAEALGSEASVEPLDPPDPAMRWMSLLERPEGGVLLWLEPAVPIEPDPATPSPPGLSGCRWVLGVQSRIEAPELFAPLTRLFKAAADRAAAILDPATGRWVFGAELARVRDRHWRVPAEWAWSTRSVERPGGDLVWLFTEGLGRVGRPELELLEVPRALAAAGAALLDALAALVIEAPPPPEARWQVGATEWVVLQRADEVASRLAALAPGSIADRDRLLVRSGGCEGRAAVCDPQPRGVYTQAWTPPERLLERVLSGEARLFRSDEESERSRRESRRHVARWMQELAGQVPAESGTARVWMRLEALEGTERVLRDYEAVEIERERVVAMPIDPGSGRPLLDPAEVIPLESLERDLADWVVQRRGRSYAAGELDLFLEEAGPTAAGDALP